METLHQPQDIIDQRYRIVTPLGRGGTGITYEAEDLINYKRVAIKAISLRNITEWKVLELFEREAKVLADLNHPAIPQYLDYFQVDTPNDRRFYLVQELVDGYSLTDLVQKGWHSDENQVKQIAIQLLEILKYLHSLKPPVIHRDIKPENIILRQDGQVFLVDFGAVQDVYRRTVTRGSTFVGTLGYMPLEQFRGQVEPASDLYSLGATLLFLLTHKSPDDLPHNKMKIDFRSSVRISDEFADWLDKMLEPAIEDRFSSASASLAALCGKEEHTQLVIPKHKQPKGSQIVFKKTNKILVVKLPGSEPNYAAFQCLMLLAIVLLVYIHGAIPYGFATVAVYIILIAGFFATKLSILFLIMPCSANRLKIDKNYFCLGWKYFFFRREVRIRIADVKQVKVKQVTRDIYPTSEGIRITNTGIKFQRYICAIAESKKWYFGLEITDIEQDWLVAELSDFLQKIKS